jgi:NADH-quinone oxidoreductase subunit A
MQFSVRYYLVAILFILFDLEVVFLVPWAASMQQTGLIAFWSVMVFLVILTVGLVYEWKRGAMEWE